MKKLIMGLMCLALAACKFSEESPKTTTPFPTTFVYTGNLKIQDLQYVGLRTEAPEASYDVNLLTQEMVITKQECTNTITLSASQTTTLLDTLKEVRLCELSPQNYCLTSEPFVLNTLSTYYKDAIDPDQMVLDLPIWCPGMQGVCEKDDIAKVIGAFDIYKDSITCP